jgi:nitroreductase
VFHRLFGRRRTFPPADLTTLSTEELLGLMRHEAHRIEKSIYNDILEKKRPEYERKRDRLRVIFGILEDRRFDLGDPTVRWAREIAEAFDSLSQDFIAPRSSAPAPFTPEAAAPLVELFQRRRSCRVWAQEQPSEQELRAVAREMVDAARWAPTSGNRQPWRFLILADPRDKELLRGLKEQHCVGAPLLVFVGMDRRVYGALGDDERSLYIDAGAAVMQMVLVAHAAGLGTCWNHFADDLIRSRERNRTLYAAFARALGIPDHVEPVAIVAIGRAAFVPPTPARVGIDDLLLTPRGR